MKNYRDGYEFYLKICKQHGLEPINFNYYILNLTQEQLDAYNEQAKLMEGQNEYEMV